MRTSARYRLETRGFLLAVFACGCAPSLVVEGANSGAASLGDLIYQLGNGFVLTIDAESGKVITNAPVIVQNFVNPVVNYAGQIIGLHLDANSWHTARLDPATGIVTDLALYTGGSQMGGQAYDPCTNRMYQVAGFQVVTIDGSTGATLATATMAEQNFTNFQAVW